MNKIWIEAKVDEVRKAAESGDFEKAHGLEDDLWAAVLEAISDGVDNPAVLAKAAFRTADIGFARYCA